jgi:hypothetical protein
LNNVLLPLLGVLLSAFLIHLLARDRAKRNTKREAGRKLREELSPELSILCPTRNIYEGTIKQILCASFIRHRQAMIEYGPYLSGKEKSKYTEKCDAYFEQGGSDCLFKKYQTKDGSKTFHKDIESLLEHIET